MRFDACAHTYDENASPQHAFAALVAEFIQPQPGAPVLELGAGTGALTRRLMASVSANLRATDASRAMVARGREKVPEASWSQLDAFVEVVPQSALQTSSGLLQWANDPTQVLNAWRASLAPGGKMVHAFPCLPCLGEWRSLVPESPVHWRDESAWREIFNRAGLHVSRSQAWVLRPVFPSALALVRSLHLSGVTGRPRIGPGRLRQALRSYDLRFRDPPGVYATWVWMAIEATV